MNLKNGEMHVISGVVAVAFTTALALAIYFWKPREVCDDKEGVDEDRDGFINCADSDCKTHCSCTGTCPPTDDDLLNAKSIEASLAYKAEEPKPKIPPKEFKEKELKIEPEGVSRDDKKEVTEKSCKKDADCAATEECIKNLCTRRKNTNVADTSPTGIIPDRTNVDSDLPTSDTPVTKPGAFDGSKYGRGPVNKGDRYFGQLLADMEFEPPELSRTDDKPPDGCIRLEIDGRISDTKFRERSTDDLQPLAEKALDTLKRKRNDKPQPVPAHLLEDLTSGWLCFKFSAQGITK